MSCPESRVHAARHGVRPKRLKAELPTGRGTDAPVAAARFGVLPMPPTRGEVTDGRQPVPTIVCRGRAAARPHLFLRAARADLRGHA